MDKLKIYGRLLDKIPSDSILMDESMSRHTSFEIGGTADILSLPCSEEEIKHILEVCKQENAACYIMGNGSNLLVRDKGIRGVVLKLAENYNKVKIENETVWAQGGILLSNLSKIIVEKGLKGFEFASGIPGTLGGAVAMNAGAYGGEMKDVITSVLAMDHKGEIRKFNNEELKLGYRSSIIQNEGYVVLEAEMKLLKGDCDEITETIKELTEKRTTKQPLHLPSAGSTFKRPAGYFAGKLIEDAGLKGVRLGGAQVSELHSGFVVNVDYATAEDVIHLIALIQKIVRDKFEVELHPEVKIIGEA